MAWYPDLSAYEYMRGQPSMVNVGWLERDRPYVTGSVPPEFLQKLQKLASEPANLCRGFHVCDLCERPRNAPAEDLNSADEFYRWSEGRRGNGEVRVRSRSVLVYSAPALVAHYVELHGYSPPKEFIQAVLESQEDDW